MVRGAGGTMRASTAFTSPLAPVIERYLTLKRALGRQYDGVRRVLEHVDRMTGPAKSISILMFRRARQPGCSPDSPLLWHRTRRGTAYTGADAPSISK